MNVKDIQEQIRIYSKKSEDIFMSLGQIFPALLNNDEKSSMNNLLTSLSSLDTLNKTVIEQETAFFSTYDKKYTPLFDSLNSKIEHLSKVNDNVKKIKDNSEEMELIALNAMVISIKSGEKGRAFSSITESLKQLSTDMNIYSNKLLDEEQQLLKQINDLKDVFNGILEYQKDLSKIGTYSSTDVSTLISNASSPLEEIKQLIASVYKPIQAAMEGLQWQDIIRQAMDHILLTLDECTPVENIIEPSEEDLDNVSFNIALMKLATSVLEDICKNIKKAIDIFNNNWQNVSNTLLEVEPKKNEYISKFLDKQNISNDNIYLNMTRIIERFADIIRQFTLYQSNQKSLERNCGSINDKAHQMFAVFEALKPIIDRLHHVRILQQIEVAKNPAIVAVKDSVTDMDNLIGSANNSLDEMQEMLLNFISSIKVLLEEFTQATKQDSDEMNKIRIAKNNFFTEFRNVQENLSSILGTFTVFPFGFERECANVNAKLGQLKNIYNELRKLIAQIADENMKLEMKKMQFLDKLQLESWTLKNDGLKDLVQKFTITAHKEEAGSIGDFNIEDGMESGEITFF